MTNFLVTNPLFRSLAIGFHNKKTSALNDIDKYMEKELLDKDTYDKIYNKKRIEKDCRSHSKTNSNPNLRKPQNRQ